MFLNDEFGTSNSPVILQNPSCTGNENDISGCLLSWNVHNCSNQSAVGVRCGKVMHGISLYVVWKKNPVLFDSLCDINSKIYVSIYVNINQVLKVATSGLHPVHRLTFSRSYGSQPNAEGYLALFKYIMYMWHTFIEK